MCKGICVIDRIVKFILLMNPVVCIGICDMSAKRCLAGDSCSPQYVQAPVSVQDDPVGGAVALEKVQDLACKGVRLLLVTW
jgi:hypothetical protein